MYADGNERPSVGETYAGAISNGSTRVGVDHTIRTSGDIVAAAGMSTYRTGMALMRLLSEWQSGATPPNLAPVPQVKHLAKQAAVARVDSGITASEEEYGGMPVSAKEARRAAAPVTKAEMELAQAEARMLAARSTDWHMHENRLRFQRLKTLPTVRAALLFWVRERGWANGEEVVASVLRYFLSPKCPACAGSGVREFAGNNRKGAGRPCRVCEENKVRGEQNIPHHGRGRSLLSHITSCVARASGELREGAHNLRRPAWSEKDRALHKRNTHIDNLRRADDEDRVVDRIDTAAVAAHFRDSFSSVKRKPKDVP